MVVGSVKDVSRDSNGQYTGGGNLEGYSSRGPVDDGRIKPDIVANGSGLLSTNGTSNGSRTSSGTSMAAPNASGSAILIQDYFHKRFNENYLRAATLKALIIHSATDTNNTGPDYATGWGILDAHAAANIIKNYADNPGTFAIQERSLGNNQSFTHTFTWDGSSPIRATLNWWDTPGAAKSSSGSDNNRTPDLVNDLNITITAPNGDVHYPYVMPFVTNGFNSADFSTPATTGVNTTDNCEQIYIANPAQAGSWTITIDHTGHTIGKRTTLLARFNRRIEYSRPSPSNQLSYWRRPNKRSSRSHPQRK